MAVEGLDPVVAEASRKHAESVGYSGSVEALGLSNAFYFGAMNQGSSSDVKLISAFIAGMAFEEETKRKVREALEALVQPLK